ncbi:MAG: UDP-N-acetylglucosamine 1-carboxyvinyltransferase [Defluviitaleaceae bacterium]|nr:UDP-N-acetylglucosamine 1-carboxyvinyltransferase [Defluviitaleaceae bacterium]
MRQYRIRGRNRLAGELCIGGAKNAVLPILAAVCLNESETVIHNCPRISDTFVSIEILKGIGCGAEFSGNTLTVKPGKSMCREIPDECVKKMRSSILFMGAMLACDGRVNLALPGGCNLGERAINLHIQGLEAMGAKISQDGDRLFCETSGLKGAKIKLEFASVGATENLMIAATKASGETIIDNAAREPEISDLAEFLKKLGADIKGAGTSRIVINGVKNLNKKVTHQIMPDRIVAGTYLVAAAMTAGEITLKNVRPQDARSFTTHLSSMGCRVFAENDLITLLAPEKLRAIPTLSTGVHPYFPTDMQAQFVAALALAHGRSIVHETIFEERCSHAAELQKMGADIRLSGDNCTFFINGVNRLNGAKVIAHDLRCGAALVLAALAAEGESFVQNAEYIERGYANIEKDLSSLGAEICLEM